MADITMPQLGETVTEGTIIRWYKQVGDPVALDEVLFEVSTDKVDTEVPSPVEGVVSDILAGEGDVVEVGQVLARIGDAGSAEAPPAKAEAPAEEPPAATQAPAVEEPEPSDDPGQDDAKDAAAGSEPDQPVVAEPATAADTPTDTEAPADPAPQGSSLVLSPIVRKLIADNNLDPAALTGSGVGGRITRSDVEKAIRAGAATRAKPKAPPPAPAAPVAPRPAAPVPSAGGATIALNNIRRRTAEHMVMSKQVSPHVLTAIEVDYENVERVRLPTRDAWKAEEGFSLTYLPFIARATVDALREFPHLNASFGDNQIVVHKSVNLAVAVDLDFNGLLAPVIHDAEGKRLRQLARDVVDLANRARTRKLRPDDLSSGTFTITNAGQYGTMMQFPIINQPQVAILSTDGISRKPVVVTDTNGDEAIAIHSVGVLALAWDHRAIDGAYAAAFLARVKQVIETRDWATEIR